jgi:PAS domain S-box-containing protein
VSSTPFLRGQAFDPGSEPETRADQFPQPVPIVESSDDWAQLHKISTLLIPEGNLDSLYNHILDAATSLMSSDMASMQLLDPERNRLRLLASKGFHPQSASFWEWVYLDSGSTCGLALFSGCRVVVADVETCDFMAGTTDLDEYRRSNIRAVQSTPLLSRSGQLLGMISTHWREPHQPPERALRRLDVLARQAADLIERSRTEVESQIEHEAIGIQPGSERAERLASLLTLSYEPMLVWQLNGPIEFWNTGAERLYGFAPEEAVGRSSHALLQTKFPVEFTELISQLQNKRYWSGELRHICKDGREVIVESRQQLLSDGTVIEVNRDVTERKKIEAALRESEQRLRWLASIVESSDDVIVSKNLDGIITSWNRGAEQVFGYTAEEAIGQPITIVIPEDRQSEEYEILTRIRGGERIDHFETVRQRKDGNLIAVSLTVSPIKDAEGKIVGASKIARDITERKQNDEHIATLALEAEHRTKNVLATVQATVNLSHSDTPDGLKRAIEGRVKALANVHGLLVKARWAGAELSCIVAQELAPYRGREEACARIDGPDVLLTPNMAQAIAVTLHELATNAAKYGSLSVPEGHLEVTWLRAADGRLILRWTESGGPPAKKPTHEGFGTSVIERMIREQLKGEIHLDWREEGLACEIALQV